MAIKTIAYLSNQRESQIEFDYFGLLIFTGCSIFLHFAMTVRICLCTSLGVETHYSQMDCIQFSGFPMSQEMRHFKFLTTKTDDVETN